MASKTSKPDGASTPNELNAGDLVVIDLVNGQTDTVRVWDVTENFGRVVYSLEDKDGEAMFKNLIREDGEWHYSFSADVESVQITPDDADDDRDAENIWVAADDAGILMTDGGRDVGYDEETAEKLKEDGFMTALERSRVFREPPHGYGVPRSIWMQGERTNYLDETGESPNVIDPRPVALGDLLRPHEVATCEGCECECYNWEMVGDLCRLCERDRTGERPDISKPDEVGQYDAEAHARVVQMKRENEEVSSGEF